MRRDASEAADLHPRVLRLTQSHQVLDPSADFEVAIRGEADSSRTDVKRVSRSGDTFSSELSNLYG